jgi:hypothetical protein
MLSLQQQQQALGQPIKTDLNPEEIEELNAFAQASLSENSKRSYQADIAMASTSRCPDIGLGELSPRYRYR